MRYYEKKERSYNFKVQEFDSIGDLYNRIQTAPTSSLYAKQGDMLESKSTYRDNWHGTSSYEEAIELLTQGWLPVAAKLSEKLPVSATQTTVKSKSPTYSTVGFQASVPRYLQGIPTNMVNHKVTTQKQKIIVINRGITFSCNWKQEKIQAEGLKALQVVQALEGHGYRVKLNVVSVQMTSVRNYHEVAVLKTCIKKPEERFNLSKVAFPIAHPSMLRRVTLRWMECFEELTSSQFTSSYGTPSVELMEYIMPKGEILMPSEIGDVKSYVNKLISQRL